MRNIAILGGGGLAKEFIELIVQNGDKPYGIFAKECNISGIPFLGYLDDLLGSIDKFDGVTLAVGGVTSEGIINRRFLIDFFNKHQIPAETLISKNAFISENVKIGKGVYIHHLAAISCDAVIEDFCAINTGAMIGHDVHIEENCTISPKVFIGGNVSVGKDSLIGAGALIKQGITIGEGCIIGMGTIVQRSLPPYSLLTHDLKKPIPLH